MTEPSERLRAAPISFRHAKEWIAEHHRHNVPPQGWKFGLAAKSGADVVGVVTAGRPVARNLDDGETLEITRCCTDGFKNACSFLYGRVARIAKLMGYTRVITYTLKREPGTSLKASGWKKVGEVPRKSWDCPSRRRDNKSPRSDKWRWELRFDS